MGVRRSPLQSRDLGDQRAEMSRSIVRALKRLSRIASWETIALPKAVAFSCMAS